MAAIPHHSALFSRRVEDSNLRDPFRPSALAPRRNRPLCQLSARSRLQRRVRDSNPQGPQPTPVFETGALPVRLTLRRRSRIHLSRYWMTSHTSLSRSPSASGRTRTCTSVHLKHAPLPIGLPKHQLLSAGVEPEGFEPSSPGCKPSILPARRRPRVFSIAALREGFEPSSSTFGGSRSDPIELPQHRACHWSLVIGHSQGADAESPTCE